ncbi:MAG: permease [Candidatus Krumholzibacteriia bacterium]
MGFLLDFATAFWLVTAQMAPWLLLGFLVAGLLSVYVSPRWLERHLGGKGMGPVWKASLFGVPLPLCSCGVIPVAASLRRHGASPAATTAFLISTPQTGIDSIAVTGALLGPLFALFRPVVALLTGVLGGGLVQLTEGKQPTMTDGAAADGPPTQGGRLRAALVYGLQTLPRDIGRPLLVGLVIAALISVLVPAGSLGRLLGGGLVPILVMIVVGMPLYVCATGSVPLAAGFIHAGVSPGAALAFLVAGPATNAATVTTLLRVLGRRTTVIYLLTVGASAVAGGVLLDTVAAHLDLRVPLLQTGHHHGGLGAIHHLWAALLVLIMIWAYWPRRRQVDCGCDAACGAQAKEISMTRLEFTVDGMNCSHCSTSVERTLREQPGVRQVTVSLQGGRAVVEGEGLDRGALMAAIEALGYRAAPA